MKYLHSLDSAIRRLTLGEVLGLGTVAALGLTANWASGCLADAAGALGSGAANGEAPLMAAFRLGLWGLLWFGASVVMLGWLYLHRGSLFGTYCLTQSGSTQARVLIHFLSKQSGRRPYRAGVPFFGHSLDCPDNGKVVLEGLSLAADLKAMATQATNPFWNWAPSLRGLAPHFDGGHRPELICIIPSPESCVELGDFLHLLSHYGIEGDCVHYFKDAEGKPTGVDFESYNALVEILGTAISVAQARLPNLKLRELVIDITGGKKITSIAAASITINQHCCFQYVGNNAPFKVKTYDVRREDGAG